MWFLLFSCVGAPATIRSEPTTPTHQLVAPEPQQVVWTDLSEVFPTVPASLPAALAELRPGLSGTRVREVLDAAHKPGVPLMGQVVDGHLVLDTLLRDHEDVGLTAILDEAGDALQELEISLPEPVALTMLSARWGEPTSLDTDASGQALYHWAPPPGGAWKVELRTINEADAVEGPHPVHHADPVRSKGVLVYQAP